MTQHPPLTRYSDSHGFKSALDPFRDLVLHLDFLRAEEYVAEVLCKRRGLQEEEAQKRAALVRPHVALALHYIDQATSGPPDVSFVPCYYAILNLIKIRLLFSDLASELAENRY